MRSRFVALAALAALTACGVETAPPEGAPASPAGPPLLARLSAQQMEGRTIYETLCWTCHGRAGRGDGPSVLAGATPAPPNFLTDEYATQDAAQLEARFRAALEGSDAAHPHMGYVARLLKPESFSAALSYVPVLAYPPGIPGSAMAGMALYESRCTGCHGAEGDGAGVAADYLEMVKPADFRADTLVARGDFDALFLRIKEGGRSIHGSSMPAWGLALGDDDIWDLVAYVATFRTGALPPLPASAP
jgi:mono/diheme cytochrome c family protein